MITVFEVLLEGTDYDSATAGHYDRQSIGIFTTFEVADNLAKELDYGVEQIGRDNDYWYNMKYTVYPRYIYNSIEEQEQANP